MNRRGFLKTLFGTTLATAIPNMSMGNENFSNKKKLEILKDLLKKGTFQIFNEKNIEERNNFLLVCLKDEHGRKVENEINFIENIIINKCQINTLFLEGWEGKETQIKRGFNYYFGEAKVVKYFVENNFNVIGLEREENFVALLKLNYKDYKNKQIAKKFINESDEFLLNPTFNSVEEEIFYKGWKLIETDPNIETFISRLRYSFLSDSRKEFIDYFGLEKVGFKFIKDSEEVIKRVEKYFEENSLGSPLFFSNWDKLNLEIRNIVGVQKMIGYIKQTQIICGFNFYGLAHYDTEFKFHHFSEFSFPNAVHIIFENFFEKEFGFKPTIVLIEPLK